MALNTEASAALVFLILYFILFALMLVGYVAHRLRFRSRYTLIFFHIAVRLASQATGLAFGIIGYAQTDLLVAYFILGAEGYFTLVICAYRFLISWQNHNCAEHESWLERRHPPGTPILTRFLDSLVLFGPRRRPMSVIHYILIGANAIIISGGSQLAGGAQNVYEFNSKLVHAKAMRAAGQSLFLAINVFLLYCLYDAIRQCKRENSGRVHHTLWILLATWPFLFVRGVYGILSAVLPAFNYFSPSNYDAEGLTNAFVTSEYILGTTTEWVSCALLMCTYVTSRHDPKKIDLEKAKEEGNGSSSVSASQG